MQRNLTFSVKVKLKKINFQILFVCLMIAFSYAAPTPNDETVAGEIDGDQNAKAEDMKQFLLLFKLKPLLLFG